MLVDRPRADRAAAGQRHRAPRRSARAAGRAPGSTRAWSSPARRARRVVDRRRVERRRVPSSPRSTRDAHLREQLAHRAHVAAGAARCRASSGSAVSSAAHRIGSAAFLAPEIADLAVERAAAVDQQLVHACFSLSRRLTRRASASSSTARGSPRACGRPAPRRRSWWRWIAALARERGRDDHGLEVLAVAVDLEVLAGEAGGDDGLDGFGGDHGRGFSVTQLVAALQQVRAASAPARRSKRADDREAQPGRRRRDRPKKP